MHQSQFWFSRAAHTRPNQNFTKLQRCHYRRRCWVLARVRAEKLSPVTSTPQLKPPSHLSVKGWAIYWPPLDAYCQGWRKYEGGLSLLFWSSLIMTYLPLSPITHTTNYLDLTEKSIAYLQWFLWLPPLIVSSCLGSALTWKGLWLPDAFRTT